MKSPAPRLVRRSSSSLLEREEIPSLVTDVPRPTKQLTPLDFAASRPVFRRDRFDLFGLNGDEKKAEKNDPHFEVWSVRKVAETSAYDQQIRRLSLVRSLTALRLEKQQEDDMSHIKISRTKESQGYSIKGLRGDDPFMRSEGSRKERLSKAIQKKKDREGLFNSSAHARHKSLIPT